MLPAAAHGAVLEPHVANPDPVTPHVVAPAAKPEVAAPSAESTSAPTAAPALAEAPPADLPSGNGPKPKPTVDTCKARPGHVCPYFCPHGALGANCKPPEPDPEPWQREPIQTVEEYMRTVHLCAGAMEVLFMKSFIDMAAKGLPYDDYQAYLQEAGVLAASTEAWNTWDRLNCLTFAQL